MDAEAFKKNVTRTMLQQALEEAAVDLLIPGSSVDGIG